MTELASLLISALILGLFSSTHCIGMCGGLVSAISLAMPEEARSRRLYLLLSYNLGRILSYAGVGYLFGLLGASLPEALAPLLRTLAGGLLILMGLYLSGLWDALSRLERLAGHLWRHLQPLSRHLLPVRSARQALGLGLLWGWLPCGLVYSTLLWSASQGDAGQAALIMAAFGLGTAPILLATGLLASQLQRWLTRRQVRLSTGLLVMLFGLWSLPGPHQHWLMGH